MDPVSERARRIVRVGKDMKMTPYIDKFEGQRFNPKTAVGLAREQRNGYDCST